VLFKRKLTEIKSLSYLLFGSVMLFIILAAFDLLTSPHTIDTSLLFRIKPGYGLITAMSILSCAFFYHMIVFPAYSSLQDRSTSRFATSALLTNSICAAIYLLLSIISLLLFGDSVEANIIRNMATRPGRASFCLRSVFCLLLLSHIPYVFHPLKEAAIVFSTEYQNRSISEGLEQKINEARRKKSEEEQPLKRPSVTSIPESEISYSFQSMTESNLALGKEVSDMQYLMLALAIHILVVLVAVSIDNVAHVFDFVSAFGITLLMYILPSLFYLYSSSKFQRRS
jgi:amino acid permease